ncbi:MAG: type II secretion system protein GspG [bacterium]
MKQTKKISFDWGFTLIELLVVISIIGILGSVVMVSVNSVRIKARDAQRVANINQIANAIALYQIDSGGVPPGENGVEYVNGNPEWIPGLAPKYMSSVPSDPIDAEEHKFHYSRQGNDYEVISFLEQNGNDAACGDGGSSCQYYEKASGAFLALVNPGASGWRFASSTEVVIIPPPTLTSAPPAPTGLRVGFGIGSGVNNWVKAAESLSFNFDAGSLSNVSAFRLYQKKPQDSAFNLVAEFSNPPSSPPCNDKRTYGTWSLISLSVDCPGSAWHISRTSLYPVSNYAIGDYLYYVTAVDVLGAEGPPSITGISTFLETFAIQSPILVESSGSLNPTFRWPVVNGWPQTPAYWIIVALSDGTGQQRMLLPYSTSGPIGSKVYDGPTLVPNKEYSVWIYGRTHSPDQSEDQVSFASGTATFMVTAPTSD